MVTSNFNSGTDGWTISEDGSPVIDGSGGSFTYDPTGGVDGTGAIHYLDTDSGPEYLHAPAEFLGDQSSATIFSFSARFGRVNALGTNDTVRITGTNGDWMEIQYNPVAGGTSYNTYELDLTDPTIWSGVSSQSEIDAILADVADIRIQVDAYRGYHAENTAEFDNISLGTNVPPCFVKGTEICTNRGPVPVEKLVDGDLIATVDNGYQPLRMICSAVVGHRVLSKNTNLCPIRIRAGAIGLGSPNADLLVSPQHRILVKSEIVRRMFGKDDVLIAAKHLLNVDGFDLASDVVEVVYFHLVFDQHELIYSNGAETESLFLGPMALRSISPDARSEIMALFPEVADLNFEPVSVRKLLNGRSGRRLAARHKANARPLVPERLSDAG